MLAAVIALGTQDALSRQLAETCSVLGVLLIRW